MKLLRSLLVVSLTCLVCGQTTLQAQSALVRGDVNGDGKVTISDAFFLNAFLFAGYTPPECIESGDVDGNSRVDIRDTVAVLVYLFLDGVPPCHKDEESCELVNTSPREAGSVQILDASLIGDSRAVLTIGVTSGEDIGGLRLSFSASEAFANGQKIHMTILQGEQR